MKMQYQDMNIELLQFFSDSLKENQKLPEHIWSNILVQLTLQK